MNNESSHTSFLPHAIEPCRRFKWITASTEKTVMPDCPYLFISFAFLVAVDPYFNPDFSYYFWITHLIMLTLHRINPLRWHLRSLSWRNIWSSVLIMVRDSQHCISLFFPGQDSPLETVFHVYNPWEPAFAHQSARMDVRQPTPTLVFF